MNLNKYNCKSYLHLTEQHCTRPVEHDACEPRALYDMNQQQPDTTDFTTPFPT